MEQCLDSEKHVMQQIENELDHMKWPSRRTREKKGWSQNSNAFALGKVRRYDWTTCLVDSRFNVKYPELLKLLHTFMSLHNDEFTFNAIQLNKNIETKPHLDKNNIGDSYCIGLGNFEGGGINIWNGKDVSKSPTPFRNRRKWLRYDGAKNIHSSIPTTEGIRYAIIFFTTCPRSFYPIDRLHPL